MSTGNLPPDDLPPVRPWDRGRPQADPPGRVRDPLAGDRDRRDFDAPPPSSGMATASLVLGIVSFCACCFSGLPAIVFGAMSLSKGRGGTGLAIAGIATGSLGTLLSIPVGIGLLLPAVAKVRDAAAQAQDINNRSMIALGLHNHANISGSLPAASLDGKLSWRVAILPMLEQASLYNQFDLKQSWDGPTNKSLASTRVNAFASASEANVPNTHVRVFTGPDTLFPPALTGADGRPRGMSLDNIVDGSSSTILMVESTESVPWPQPSDLAYSPRGPLPSLGLQHRDSFIAAMADGSVRPIKKSIDPALLRKLITPNGGEKIDLGW